MQSLFVHTSDIRMHFPGLPARRVDAGHPFPEEAPEVMNKTLIAFLAGQI